MTVENLGNHPLISDSSVKIVDIYVVYDNLIVILQRSTWQTFTESIRDKLPSVQGEPKVLQQILYKRNIANPLYNFL